MKRPNGVRIRPLPVRSIVPNALTLIALCAGLTAVRFALQGRWQEAVIAIVVAGVFDALDGRMARLLKGATKFGAELDSLSDVISFGVAPALVVYLWCVKDLKGFGWVLTLAFAVCCALRLARFNTAAEDPSVPQWRTKYFVGVPAPAAAGLVILPMLISFYAESDILRSPTLCGILMAVIAFLMVSRVPSFSLKRIAINRDQVMPILLIVALIAALVATFPWAVLSTVGIVYAASIPVSYVRFQRLKRKMAAEEASQAAETSKKGA